MTRRERIERRLEKREQWAEKAEHESKARLDAALDKLSVIPPGQPILVGHHSEKGHRAHLRKVDNDMLKSQERAEMAEKHKWKAAGLANQLERSIYSDDENAAESLGERAAATEHDCERMKAVNAAFRKAGRPDPYNLDGWKRVGEILDWSPEATEKERHKWAILRRICDYEKQPYPAYALTNARARARRDRQRAERVKREQATLEQAAEAEGGCTVREIGDGYCLVTFPEFPGREYTKALKAAGFYWRRPSWQGKRADLPDSVAEMAGLDKSTKSENWQPDPVDIAYEDECARQCGLL